MRVRHAVVNVVALLALALDCGGPDAGGETKPDPQAQKPAPNADPKPTDKERQRRYVRWQVEQNGYGLRNFTYSYRSTNGEVIITPPAQMFASPEFHKELEVVEPGVAEVRITPHEADGRTLPRMRCQVLYRVGKEGEWRIVAEGEGRDTCVASGPVTF